jgi:DNA-directed RNA polymerase subunit RPC12/RpoP
MSENELLLYPLGDPTDRPACSECGAEMPLAKLEAGPGGNDYSTFRCAACSHSETFIAEDTGQRKQSNAREW